MDSSVSHEQLVWVTRSVALNPSHILEVFHGKGGQVEVYLPGRTRQLDEHELTEAGRSLLLPHDAGRDAGTPVFAGR